MKIAGAIPQVGHAAVSKIPDKMASDMLRSRDSLGLVEPDPEDVRPFFFAIYILIVAAKLRNSAVLGSVVEK